MSDFKLNFCFSYYRNKLFKLFYSDIQCHFIIVFTDSPQENIIFSA